MKKISLVFLVTIFAVAFSFAQNVAINADGSLPNSSAMLDVSSTTKGFLPPRMTLAQRNLISLPATGIIIYQTDDISGLYVNKGTSSVPNWQLIGPGISVASPSFFFNSDQFVVGNDYIGLGSSGSNFLRFTSVVPVACVLRSITFSSREFTPSGTATVWLQPPGPFTPVATTLSANIANGYFSVASGTVALNAGDLISVRITSPFGFPSGVAIGVTYQ